MVPAASGLAITIPLTTPMEAGRVIMVAVAGRLERVGVGRVSVRSSVTFAGIFATEPAARREKVVVVIGEAFTVLLNVAVTVVLRATPVARGVGDSAITASDVGV